TGEELRETVGRVAGLLTGGVLVGQVVHRAVDGMHSHLPASRDLHGKEGGDVARGDVAVAHLHPVFERGHCRVPSSRARALRAWSCVLSVARCRSDGSHTTRCSGCQPGTVAITRHIPSWSPRTTQSSVTR